MNVFYLDPDPLACAQYHNDKHASKMILEGAQLLSTVKRIMDGRPIQVMHPTTFRMSTHYLLDGENVVWDEGANRHRIVGDNLTYKVSHATHPCTIWVGASLGNFEYLQRLTAWLNIEQRYRRHKDDPSWDHASALVAASLSPPTALSGAFFEPPQVMPDDCKQSCTVEAYRTYYRQHKQAMASWTLRGQPHWY